VPSPRQADAPPPYAILDAIPAHIALLDATGRIQAVNAPWRASAAACGLSGATVDVGADYLAVCEAASGPEATEARQAAEGIRAVLSGRLPSFTLEYPCHAPEREQWFRMTVHPLPGEPVAGVVVMHTDVSERRSVEDALARAAAENLRVAEDLRAERERLVAAQEVAHIGSWETDLATLQVRWSDETFRIFGLVPGVATPSHQYFLSLVHPDDRAEVDAAFQASFETREVCIVEHRLILPDGTVKHVEERWQTLTDGGTAVTRAVGTCQDITARKLLEMRFLRAQRLESVGTLAGGIAHDLNNVLAPILSAVELLILDETHPERLEWLQTIARGAHRGTDLVKQVLAFARGVEGKRVAVQLRDVAREVELLMRETFPKHLQIELAIPPDLHGVTGDPTHLHQVLLNLCVNARDACSEGGTIVVDAANVTIDAEGPGAPGEYVRLGVADTGGGIPPEIQDRIFEPFFTTKELGRGTGLGLSTVHTIVQSYGGFIRLDSAVGRGTRFDIYLPARRAGSAVDGTPERRRIPRGRGETILVVDDEATIRSVVQRILERFDYRVLTAADGAEAVRCYAEHRGTIRLVLTDMTMPVMGGAAAIVALRTMNPALPIIASSGQDTDERTIAALGIGQVPFVAKPYTTDVLLTAIAKALRTTP
jgi:PAS domain S-box-containing protein